MPVIALPDHPTRPHLSRAVVAAFIGLGLLIGSLLAGAAMQLRADGVTVRTSAASSDASVEPAPSAVDTIGAWLAANGAIPGDYTGTCEHDGRDDALCSALREDLGDTQIHTLGVYASEFGVDVLLDTSTDQWQVVAAQQWPELGEPYDGPPWSPLTAITAWWSDRATAMYGTDAVHLRDCADASGIGPNDQTLLCSTLVEEGASIRVYDSGRTGAPADVRITVTEQRDHTWAVSETLAR